MTDLKYKLTTISDGIIEVHYVRNLDSDAVLSSTMHTGNVFKRNIVQHA